MDQRSVFFDEWLRSLREQFKHVVRSKDQVTLPTLTAVMHNVGFGEEELNQLRLEATIRADELPEDFTPDLNIIEKAASPAPHPAECLCPQCIDLDDGAHDADGQPLIPEPEPSRMDERVFPAADISQLEPEDDSEPVTFEDELARESEAMETSEVEQSTDDAMPSDDSEPDPDAPEQMSLF